MVGIFCFFAFEKSCNKLSLVGNPNARGLQFYRKYSFLLSVHIFVGTISRGYNFSQFGVILKIVKISICFFNYF